MAELKRTIKCSNCGNESNVYLSSDLTISELLLHGRCQRCGNSLQINYTLVEQGQNPSSTQQQSSSQSEIDAALPNLDQSLFETQEQLPSDAIKELIEE
jgi:transcription elongation factor Elf1